MKSVLAALGIAIMGWVTPPAAESASSPSLARVAGEVRDAAASVAIAERAPAIEAAPTPALETLPEAVVVRQYRRVVRIPERCRTSDGSYDVVVHFHGAPETVIPAFERSGLDAVLVVVNLGIGSGPYEKAFLQAGSLDALLASVHKAVAKHCPMPERKLGRLALSSWSAGYGAIYRILAREDDARRVDAVLLSDGLHAGFDDRFRKHVNALQMAPFDQFARRAARGEALMTVTHSAIVTTYASTTETASHLIEAVGLEREAADEAGPREMQLRSRAQQGAFSVLGYAGGDTDAHCDHLYAMDRTVLSSLAAHWR